jgi:hypothetical protein
MKRKILLSCLFIIFLSAPALVYGQVEEYYRPDTLILDKEKIDDRDIRPFAVDKKAFTEKKDNSDFKNQPKIDRLRTGGSFGLSLGTVTNINIAPNIGYELTEKLVAGVGANLMYFKYRYYNINTLYYGGKGFLMYSVLPMVNLIGEFEAMNVEGSYQKRQWLGSPMVGASYSQAISKKLVKAVHFTVLYNLNYNNQLDQYSGQNLSPYGSPFVFRVTFL